MTKHANLKDPEVVARGELALRGFRKDVVTYNQPQLQNRYSKVLVPEIQV